MHDFAMAAIHVCSSAAVLAGVALTQSKPNNIMLHERLTD